MSDTLSLILLQLSPFPAAFVCNYALAHFLDLTRKKTFAFCITMVSFVIQTVCRICPGIPAPQYVNTTLQVLLMFGASVLLSKISLGYRIFAPVIAIIITSIPEPLVLLLMVKFGLGWNDPSDYLALASDPSTLFFIRFPFFVLVCLFSFLGIIIWDKIVKKASNQILFPFLLFPCSQAFLLLIANIFAEAHAKDVQSVVYSLVLVAAVILCLIADYLLFRSLQKATEQAAAEERAEWFEYLLGQQSLYYEQYLSDIEDVSRIRHDLRNQLQTAYTLMAQHEEEKARAILDNISELLDTQQVFCKNRVVNAILALKGNLCSQAGISFDVDCVVPDDIPLSEISLCSLFTNVLDNAYHATVQCKKEEQKIRLSARIKNNFFIIICRNPVEPGSKGFAPDKKQDIAKKPGQRHGLGLTILQSIADTYHGTVEVEQTENEFHIKIMLQL